MVQSANVCTIISYTFVIYKSNRASWCLLTAYSSFYNTPFHWSLELLSISSKCSFSPYVCAVCSNIPNKPRFFATFPTTVQHSTRLQYAHHLPKHNVMADRQRQILSNPVITAAPQKHALVTICFCFVTKAFRQN